MKLKDAIVLEGTDSVPYEGHIKEWAASALLALRTAQKAISTTILEEEFAAIEAVGEVLRATEEEV